MDASCILIGLIIMVTAVNGQTSLDKVEERLDAIDRKFAKVDALLDGLEQLCHSLSIIQSPDSLNNEKRDVPVEEHEIPAIADDNKEDDGIKKSNVNGGQAILGDHQVDLEVEKRASTLELVDMTSEPQNDMDSKATLVFVAGDGYAVEWYIGRGRSAARTKGLLTKDVLSDQRYRYTVTMDLLNSSSLNWLHLLVYSSEYSATLRINGTTLNLPWTQNFAKVGYEILEYEPRIVLSGDTLENEGLIVTVKVSEHVVEALKKNAYYPEISFRFVNTSETPAHCREVWDGQNLQSGDPGLSVGVKEGSKDEMVITVHRSIAVFGGLLLVRLPQNTTGSITNFAYGIQMKVINEDNGDIMPYGTVGLYQSRGVEYTTGYESISCYASGIPLPRLSILKKRPNGRFFEVKSAYEIIYGNTSLAKVIAFDPKTSKKSTGEYICRASNANETVEDRMTVVELKNVKIDNARSVLKANTTGKTVVTCKATGSPTPQLEMRADHAHGINVLEYSSPQYQHRFNTRKNVNRVTLVIRPPDEWLDTIFCVAKQSVDYGETYMDILEIKIRPRLPVDFDIISPPPLPYFYGYY